MVRPIVQLGCCDCQGDRHGSEVERYDTAKKAFGDAAIHADKVGARQEGRKVSKDDRRALDSATKEFLAAERALGAVVPTTKKGNQAKLKRLSLIHI